MNVSKLTMALLCTFSLGVTAHAENAATFPDKPVTILVPYTAGGGSDNISRAMARSLAEQWGQPVIVENKPGADGLIATNQVIRSAPDGYTLLVSVAAIAMLKHTNKSLTEDPLSKLAPVTMMAEGPMAFVVKGGTDIQNVSDFKNYCSSATANCSWASGDPGTLMVGTGIMSSLGLKEKATNVRYSGTAVSVSDLSGGHVTSLVTGTAAVLSPHRAGKLKILAVSSDKRIPELAEVPTFAEAGIKDAMFVTNWYGVFAPAGTPEPIREKIAAGFNKAAQSPDVLKALKPLLLNPVGNTPQEFAAQIANDQKIIDAVGPEIFKEN